MKIIEQQTSIKRTTPFNMREGSEFARLTADKFFVGMSAKNYFSQTRGLGKGVKVAPNEYSDDIKYRMFLTDLVKELNSNPALKVEIDGAIFGSNGVSGNFNQLYTISGYRAHPLGFSPTDNVLLRDSMGLERDFKNERHKSIFDKLVQSVYGDRIEAAPSISKKSSSGAPFFSYDNEFKYKHFKFILQNYTEFESLVKKKDLKAIYERFKVLFSGSQSNRLSADSNTISEDGTFEKSKERWVADLIYATTGGRNGSRILASKKVVKDGNEIKGFSAMRDRLVVAFNHALNILFSATFEGFRKYMELEYEYTYKHRTRKDIEDKVNMWKHIYPFDVTQYDATIPRFMVKRYLEQSPFNEVAQEIIMMMFDSPLFYKAQDDHEQYWSGDPLDLNYYNQFGGLPSGLFLTSSLGKVCFTFALLVMIDESEGRALEDMEEILKGKSTSGFLNMSDDTVFGTNSISVKKYLDDRIERGVSISDYFKVDLEDGLKFLGNVGYRKEPGGRINICGDVVSFLKNMLIPEVGIDSKRRPFPIFGLITRRDVFQDNPSFHLVDEIFKRMWKKHFEVDWYSYMKAHEELPPTNISGEVLSLADVEVLADPAKMFYKYDSADISPNILEIIGSTIPLEDCRAATTALTNYKYK